MLLVHSTVWVDFFNGRRTLQTDYLDRALGDQLILVGDLILAEVFQGFRSEVDFEQARQALSRFEQVTLVDLALAVQSARNYRTLRSQGVTLRKTIDCLIATYCIEHGHTFLHCDGDFDGFAHHLGLRVIDF
jgi:hypothetical protein